MSTQPGDIYLETEVLTASPQRLRLMLLHRALRDVDLVLQHWESGANDAALEALIHCREVVAELIGGIQPETSELAQRVLGLYLFVFRALSEAQLSRDRDKLLAVRRVLAAERETWQQVCQQITETPVAPAPASAEVVAPAALPMPVGSEALSLEA